MNDSREPEISQYEARLRQAMLQSDLNELDLLIAPDLIFTSHFGQLVTKNDDLEAHRSGVIKIESLTLLDETIRMVGSVAIVSALVRISGTIGDITSEGDYRFTRVWAPTSSGEWQIVAGHASAVFYTTKE
jgi:ketosteroid isomerase-like protein